MQIEPITLTGNYVRLEPLSETHIAGLAEAGRDPEIWRYLLYGEVTSLEKMQAFVQARLAEKAAGVAQPFAVIHLESGKLAGMTRYKDFHPEYRNVEIGGTWYGTAFQRTVVNTETKYLLLCHAFDTLGCIRVQLKTDVRNERSRKAIQRIGAVQEGILRNHMIRPDGAYRDSIFFSIIESEWPDVKIRLETLLQQK